MAYGLWRSYPTGKSTMTHEIITGLPVKQSREVIYAIRRVLCQLANN